MLAWPHYIGEYKICRGIFQPSTDHHHHHQHLSSADTKSLGDWQSDAKKTCFSLLSFLSFQTPKALHYNGLSLSLRVAIVQPAARVTAHFSVDVRAKGNIYSSSSIGTPPTFSGQPRLFARKHGGQQFLWNEQKTNFWVCFFVFRDRWPFLN